MADPKKRRTVFDPIDEDNTEEQSTGAGTLVDSDLPGGGPQATLTEEQTRQLEQQAQEVTDAYAKEWEEILQSDEEAK